MWLLVQAWDLGVRGTTWGGRTLEIPSPGLTGQILLETWLGVTPEGEVRKHLG